MFVKKHSSGVQLHDDFLEHEHRKNKRGSQYLEEPKWPTYLRFFQASEDRRKRRPVLTRSAAATAGH